MMPFISIIVPVYNVENLLQRCIESLISQSFKDIEIILINDGSTDSSFKICLEYAKRDHRIFAYTQENKGVSYTRNRGIDIAKGDYILFVDSDDYLPVEYCEKLVDAWSVYGANTLYITSMLYITVEKQILMQYDNKDDYTLLSRKDILKIHNKYLLNAPVNKLYDRTVIKKNHIKMLENIRIAEDLLFNLNYLDKIGDCPICCLNHVFYMYVDNRTSLVHRYHENFYDIQVSIHSVFYNKCLCWNVPFEDYGLFYKRYWEAMEGSLKNTMLNNSINDSKKFYINNQILKSKPFKKVMKKNRKDLSLFKYYIYRLGNYHLYSLICKYKSYLKR